MLAYFVRRATLSKKKSLNAFARDRWFGGRDSSSSKEVRHSFVNFSLFHVAGYELALRRDL